MKEKDTVTVFEEIKAGLEQAIEYEKGNLKARTTVLSIEPLTHFTAEDIKRIRKSTGLTQQMFAGFMGVSIKTVEAWESGRNKPEGPACRILSLIKRDPQFPRVSGIIGT